MRELNKCRAEVFRRSEKRIKARKRRRQMLALCVPLCLLIAVWSVTSVPPSNGGDYDGVIGTTSGNEYKGGKPNASGSTVDSSETIPNGSIAGNHYGTAGNTPGSSNGTIPNKPESVPAGTADSFSFSLTWGCYGISSYDSETGKLVKTTDATNPEDYITTYQLTDAQKQQIYDLVKDLNVTAYPDTYNPHTDGLASKPSMTLILTVNTGTVHKTITAKGIALTFESQNSQGQKFLSVCKAIADILMETDEWKALPEYEFFYE